jgi:hypothetical protein
MSKDELAGKLNGREYRQEITKQECDQAKASGLVVVFGYSDDNIEFRGAIDEEAGCSHGAEILLSRSGLLPYHDRCECPFCGYEAAVKKARKIETLFSRDGYTWIYRTDLPHAAFDIMDEGRKFCRGIVFEASELQA